MILNHKIKVCIGLVVMVFAVVSAVHAIEGFVRGTVIFEDLLSAEKVGEFPSRWGLEKGSAEVAVYDGGKVLSFLTTQTEVKPFMQNKDYLPEIFSIEFDYLMNHFKQHSYEINFFGSNGRRSGILRFNGERYSLNAARGGEISSGNTPYTSDSFTPGWRRFALSFNQREMRVFCDGVRVLNVPRLEIEMKSLLIRGGRPKGARPNSDAFIRNFLITEGGMPLYERVMAEGKFVTNDILFDVNRAKIKPESMAVINQVFAMMQAHRDLRFSVEGHTDSDGDAELNQRLSLQRAQSVADALVGMGIEADRIVAKGFGASKPVADDNTADGKAQNRRVEFISLSLDASAPQAIVDDDTIAFITIGNQQWTSRNLDVSVFRNGDPIMEAKTAEQWIEASENRQPAWCYYDNDPNNGKIYGKLYNWYAVSDPRGLAPEGWRVATDKDWQQLERFLGMTEEEVGQTRGRGDVKNVGGKLKSTTGWNEPNHGATNESGFSGLPGGTRGNGEFAQIGRIGFWWTTSTNDDNHLWFRYLYHGFPVVTRETIETVADIGISVRCVKE